MSLLQVLLYFEIFSVWVLLTNHCEFYYIVCYILYWVRCIVYRDELVTLLYCIGKYLMLTFTLFLSPTPEKVHLYAVIVVPGKDWIISQLLFTVKLVLLNSVLNTERLVNLFFTLGQLLIIYTHLTALYVFVRACE